MSRVLTSWKKIAKYVGKGVRTVQRWETAIGFPARRESSHAKGTVIAFTDEIDSWLHSRFSSPLKSQLEDLRQTVNRLSEENEDLRRQLASFQKAKRKSSTQL